MILTVLTTVTVCSRLAANKVVLLDASLPLLAEVAVEEAVTALQLESDDELSLGMVCEISTDFLKLAAIY